MVRGEAGVTLLPAMSLPVENRGGALAVRRFQAPAPGRTIVLAWRPQSPRALALGQVAEVLRETARRLKP
jgi:LysR family hydrogen peroxide-inducible transcriptional activator